MLVGDFIFLSINTYSSVLIFLILFIFNRLFLTNSSYSFTALMYLLFLLLGFLLIWVGLDLLGLLIILSETIVFFYFFLITLVKNIRFIKPSSSVFLLYFAFFIVSCWPVYVSFYNYNLIKWFYLNKYMYSDIFGVYMVLYYFEYLSLYMVGLLLLVVTYILCYIAILYHSDVFTSGYKSRRSSSFLRKTQKKSSQLCRKSYITNIHDKRSDN